MLTEQEVKKYTLRMMQSRMRVICNNGFLGVLLTHMRMMVDEHLPTAATDGKFIYFGKEFLIFYCVIFLQIKYLFLFN